MCSSSNGKSLFFSPFVSFSSSLQFCFSTYTSLLSHKRYLKQITYWRQEELACRLLTHTTPVSRGYSVSMRPRQMCRNQFSSEAKEFIKLITIYSQESSPRCVEMGGKEPEIRMVYQIRCRQPNDHSRYQYAPAIKKLHKTGDLFFLITKLHQIARVRVHAPQSR